MGAERLFMKLTISEWKYATKISCLIAVIALLISGFLMFVIGKLYNNITLTPRLTLPLSDPTMKLITTCDLVLGWTIVLLIGIFLCNSLICLTSTCMVKVYERRERRTT